MIPSHHSVRCLSSGITACGLRGVATDPSKRMSCSVALKPFFVVCSFPSAKRLAGFKKVDVTEKENLVGKVFSSVAPQYDVMNDVMSGGLHRLWKDTFVGMLRPAPGIHHLDVAGGTGDVAFRILSGLRHPKSKTYEGSITVLDINAAMVEEGKKKADRLGLSGPLSSPDFISTSLQIVELPFRNQFSPSTA